MAEGLVSRLLAHLDKVEQELNADAGHPFAGLPDDELHERWQHPAYEYATTEGQRKMLDTDEPPYVDGDEHPELAWEHNVTPTNYGGFDRGDYVETQEWRRLKPEGERERTWSPPEHVVAGLRLVRAHRDIAEMAQAMFGAVADRPGLSEPDYTDGLHRGIREGNANAYSYVLAALARGYGLEDQT